MAIRMGTHRHLESQPLQEKRPVCRRYRQYRHGHHHSAGVPASRRHPPPLDKPRYAFFEKHQEDPCLWQTRGMDHARYVALYRYLPPRPPVHPLRTGMPPLPLPLLRQRKARPLIPRLPQKERTLPEPSHHLRSL